MPVDSFSFLIQFFVESWSSTYLFGIMLKEYIHQSLHSWNRSIGVFNICQVRFRTYRYMWWEKLSLQHLVNMSAVESGVIKKENLSCDIATAKENMKISKLHWVAKFKKKENYLN